MKKPKGRKPQEIKKWLEVNNDNHWSVCVCSCGRWYAQMDHLAPYHFENCYCKKCDKKTDWQYMERKIRNNIRKIHNP